MDTDELEGATLRYVAPARVEPGDLAWHWEGYDPRVVVRKTTTTIWIESPTGGKPIGPCPIINYTFTRDEIRYILTDTIGDSGTIIVISDTRATDVVRWYNCTDQETVDTIWRFVDSLGTRKPLWDEQAADFLGLKVEVEAP